MRFLLVFFCFFLITACQDNPAPDSDYEDDFLLVAHQTMTPLDSDYSQDMNLKALVRNRIADGPDDGRWIRTTLPWLRLGSGELDTRDLERLGERAEPLLKFLSTGTLSRVEGGEITDTRIADQALYQTLVERFGDKVQQLLDQATATAVPLPSDPRPGDTWHADAALWGLPRITADYEVLARDGDRVLIKLTLAGDGVTGQARMIARWPSGMPEALRLHSTVTLAEQNARVEQRLLLISQTHYPYPVKDWDVDPIQAEMQADFTERRLANPIFMEAEAFQPLQDVEHVNTLLDSLEDSLFYRPDEHRLVTTGDWTLATPLQQQTSFHLTGLGDDAPAGLVVNRLAESGGFYGLADPGPQDLGRDLLIATPNHPMPSGEPITVNGEAGIWIPGEAVTVRQGDDLPEGTQVLEWGERRVDLHLENEGRLSARPLGADGELLDFAVVYRAPNQGDTSAETFVNRLTLGMPPARVSLLTQAPIAALRLTPLQRQQRPLTFTVRPLPDEPMQAPGGVRHQASPLPPVPDRLGGLLERIELRGQDQNRLRVTGPAGLRLCTLTPADGSAHHGTPLHFTWAGGDRDQGTRPGFELRTEDDQIRYFYGREIAFEARCPTEVDSVTLTPDAPGCARFEGDNGVALGDDCGGIAHLDFAAVDDTGLALQPLGEDDNGVRRFWGPVKEVRFLRAQGEQRRALTAKLPELPQ
jgi:hypothetical protein